MADGRLSAISQAIRFCRPRFYSMLAEPEKGGRGKPRPAPKAAIPQPGANPRDLVQVLRRFLLDAEVLQGPML